MENCPPIANSLCSPNSITPVSRADRPLWSGSVFPHQRPRASLDACLDRSAGCGPLLRPRMSLFPRETDGTCRPPMAAGVPPGIQRTDGSPCVTTSAFVRAPTSDRSMRNPNDRRANFHAQGAHVVGPWTTISSTGLRNESRRLYDEASVPRTFGGNLSTPLPGGGEHGWGRRGSIFTTGSELLCWISPKNLYLSRFKCMTVV